MRQTKQAGYTSLCTSHSQLRNYCQRLCTHLLKDLDKHKSVFQRINTSGLTYKCTYVHSRLHMQVFIHALLQSAFPRCLHDSTNCMTCSIFCYIRHSITCSITYSVTTYSSITCSILYSVTTYCSNISSITYSVTTNSYITCSITYSVSSYCFITGSILYSVTTYCSITCSITYSVTSQS